MTTITSPSVDTERQVTRFDVERLACGELQGADKARVEAAVAGDAALKAFYDDVKASDAAFLALNPPTAFFAKQAPAPSLVQRMLAFAQTRVAAAAASAVAAAALVLVVVGEDAATGNRTKGGEEEAPAVSFFVQERDAARVGNAGEQLHAGDRIQLAVKDAPKPAMVIVGVDGAGAVSVYAREQVTQTAKGALKLRLLPASLILDDTVGPERFFVVYGDDLQRVERDAKQAADKLGARVKSGLDLATVDKLDVDGPQSSIHIVKVAQK